MFDDKEEAAEYIFEKCDENQDGYIDFEEFRHIITAIEQQKEELPTSQELLFEEAGFPI
jgi:Ca2+-binding EF-hand superfamily protein